MSIEDFAFVLEPPTPEAFVELRDACGWGRIEMQVARRALSGSVVDLTCNMNGNLVGMGRVVGDGVLYFYLQDIIVRPEYRGFSIGRVIVQRLLDEVMQRAETGATIGLMSAQGKEDFYAHFGFEHRPSNTLGAGMTKFVLA